MRTGERRWVVTSKLQFPALELLQVGLAEHLETANSQLVAVNQPAAHRPLMVGLPNPKILSLGAAQGPQWNSEPPVALFPPLLEVDPCLGLETLHFPPPIVPRQVGATRWPHPQGGLPNTLIRRTERPTLVAGMNALA